MVHALGIKPRSGKFPILGKNDSGKTYKFRDDTVRRTLGGYQDEPVSFVVQA